MTHSRQVMTSARSNEHYTPAAVLAPVYEILGTVELDPCSNSKTNPNVKCNRCFVRDDDGLTQDWNAKTVFVNPPFSSSAAWAAKAIAEHQTNQTEIIFLCKAAVDTRWGQRLLDYPHCHWRGRIKFEGNGGKLAPFACTIFYLGDHWQKFQQVFNSYGVVQPGRILCQVTHAKPIGYRRGLDSRF